MKQKLLTKMEQVPILRPTLLRDVIADKLEQLGLEPDLSLIKEASKYVLFSIDGEIPNDGTHKLDTLSILDTEVNVGQDVRLLPAVAGG